MTSSSLSSLPSELLSLIFRHLPPSDLLSVSLVSRDFHAISRLDSVWAHAIQRELGVKLSSAKKQQDKRLSNAELYLRLLGPYGHCLGLWQRTDIRYYGSLHQVYACCWIEGHAK